jgi:hypothetical protein
VTVVVSTGSIDDGASSTDDEAGPTGDGVASTDDAT